MNLLYRGGCFLPFLLIFNFFFGWIFLGFRAWILIEIILVIILMIYSYFLSRKIISEVNGSGRKDNVIDVESEVEQ